ncbi:uncharacterized protein B0P05DRAFT_561650 [Gilbertella persicaria]|uniref:uncharacterized protein n=1 Tax=Gilbertella persicaria TaxID=101096 RepID=UPI00221FF2EE|nr:uncharacterized protein B0P05DRAFT_561650 [Gilbertella persicaria]KAI8053118.1 hypothetical protein B0P05DRAFT_561650 [Gilbertella persicaria]
MGAQTSKVARKLPTKARPETFQNIPKESPSTLGSTINAASEIKDEFIEQDSRDPQLLENLRNLGPVKVPPTVTKMRASDTMLGIMRQRQEAEEREVQGLRATEEAISIDSLFALLEQRKRLAPGDIDKPEIRQTIMEKYKVDANTLTTILKYYNTMAIMPPALDDKEERRMGIWVKDKVEWESNVKKMEERNAVIKKAKEEALKDNKRASNGNKQDSKEDQALKDLFDESY